MNEEAKTHQGVIVPRERKKGYYTKPSPNVIIGFLELYTQLM